jgi:hypothetical protein
MVYEVPASKKSVRQNQFSFKIPGKTTTYHVPKAKFLPVGVIERMSTKSDEISISDILGLFGDGAAADAVRTLDQDQLKFLTEAWQKDSGLTVGESSASTAS